MTTLQQVENFYRFATQQLHSGDSKRSVEELFDDWRFRESREEDVAAVQAALEDMKQGDTGRDASEIERELREELSTAEPTS